MTMTEAPAIEMVVLRAAPLLGETARVTAAGPIRVAVPELFAGAPDTVIQLGRPEIVQEHEVVVWTLTVKSPPPTGACNEVGATE